MVIEVVLVTEVDSWRGRGVAVLPEERGGHFSEVDIERREEAKIRAEDTVTSIISGNSEICVTSIISGNSEIWREQQ